MKFLTQGRIQRQSTFIPAFLSSLGLDSWEKPDIWPTMKPTTNLNLNTLHLDSPHDENIAGQIEVLVKDAYNADKAVVLAGKKRTWRKVALLLNKDIAPARKKRTWEKKRNI